MITGVVEAPRRELVGTPRHKSATPSNSCRDAFGSERGVRYGLVHTVTHTRLLTETDKSTVAIGRPGMTASRNEENQQSLLLGRRWAFRVLCRSDLLSGSMFACIVRSEFSVPCAVYASASPCQVNASTDPKCASSGLPDPVENAQKMAGSRWLLEWQWRSRNETPPWCVWESTRMLPLVTKLGHTVVRWWANVGEESQDASAAE